MNWCQFFFTTKSHLRRKSQCKVNMLYVCFFSNHFRLVYTEIHFPCYCMVSWCHKLCFWGSSCSSAWSGYMFSLSRITPYYQQIFCTYCSHLVHLWICWTTQIPAQTISELSWPLVTIYFYPVSWLLPTYLSIQGLFGCLVSLEVLNEGTCQESCGNPVRLTESSLSTCLYTLSDYVNKFIRQNFLKINQFTHSN